MVRAVSWPGPSLDRSLFPGRRDRAKVKAAPARGPARGSADPPRPWLWLRSRRSGTGFRSTSGWPGVARDRAVETILTKSGWKASMRSATCSRSLSARKVVKADQQSRARRAQFGAQFVQLPVRSPSADSTSRSTICSQPRGSREHLKLCFQGLHEVPAKLLAAAGGDDRRVAMGGEKLLHSGQRRGRLGQRIQPELEQPGVGQRRRRPLDQLLRGAGLDGYAQLAHIGQAQPRLTGAGGEESELEPEWDIGLV